ncbi:MAG TPA: 50S ribosomal protein L29 [Candidatus Thalassarchaeaceae archaeon]|jgi:ribosomal protein L29|nr:50S ribosomal protein L29 [Candidatus Thalassarchaeaceae archaeon]HJM19285.1 50S ribosomal protein L29 [Candidatus Thalassarchaeaceae archaeon]HJM87220.1 50S ribosomal protein L29 [Candidatus Thalassarchaeaceae archaeon]
MTHLSNREIDNMSTEARNKRLLELKEEMLQLRAEQALGGSASNAGAYKQVRRSIARLRTKMNQERKGVGN